MSEPVLDTMVLQAFGFGHPDGFCILFEALGESVLRFPPEVYDLDEASVPLDKPDRGLSELASGLRFAQRQVERLPHDESARYRRWLDHARQIRDLITADWLRIDVLSIESLRIRAALMDEHGIGRGEAACIALAIEEEAPAVFVSSDQKACRVAEQLDVPYVTIVQLLERWILSTSPNLADVIDLLDGFASARFQVSDLDRERLLRLLPSR